MQMIHLPESLDIRAAVPLAAELLGARGQNVSIDASNVVKVGAQCVQVLLSARSTWASDGVSLVVTNPSEPLLEALETLGIGLGEISEQEAAK
jgi:chemotaxis protein CheX